MVKAAAQPVMALPPALELFFKANPAIAAAYSGGVDSRFLCHAALLAGADVLAMHASGPHIAPQDTAGALHWAEKRGFPCVRIEINPLGLPEVATNSRQRCLACKKFIFAAIKSKLAEIGEAGRPVCDGGNHDDLGAYRPGAQAAREAGVISPLAGMPKSEIRSLGFELGLDNPGQKARPCLLTRLAYGMEPTPELLARLAEAEREIGYLLQVASRGDCDFRLRLLPEPELHLTQEAGDLYLSLAGLLEKHGFFPAKIRRLTRLSGFFDACANHARLLDCQNGMVYKGN